MLTASCHCGAVRLEIASRPRSLTDCNCSICRRYAALWAYCTRKSVQILTASPASRQIYMWGDKTLEFHRCASCGCIMYHERAVKAGDETRLGINTRMLPPEVIAGIRIRRLDGAATWKYLD